MNGTLRKDVQPGTAVLIIEKHHQTTGRLTKGTVRDILTNKAKHPRGIKVRLTDGTVGRVLHIGVFTEQQIQELQRTSMAQAASASKKQIVVETAPQFTNTALQNALKDFKVNIK